MHRESVYQMAIQRGICDWMVGEEMKPVEKLLALLEKWAVQTYEGKKVTFGFFINPKDDSLPTAIMGETWLKFLENDYSAVLTDCIHSVIQLDKTCGFVRFLSLAEGGTISAHQLSPFLPLRFSQCIDKYIKGSAVGIFLLNNGDIVLSKEGKINLVKRNLHWLNFSFAAFHDAICDEHTSWNEQLLKEVYATMVIINNREYALDIQEMILWAALNWQIMDAGSLENAYSAKLKASGIRPQRSISDCMRRLMQRGLVVEGCGETDEDALYALLSGLYVVPISDSLLLRLISFIKLTVFGHVPFAVTRKLFRKDRRSANERRVYRLSRQALLSTAELIKCVEYDIHTIHSDSQLMDALYADDTTTSDNIADMVRPFVCCRPVLQAVANLYLRRQIIFERLS